MEISVKSMRNWKFRTALELWDSTDKMNSAESAWTLAITWSSWARNMNHRVLFFRRSRIYKFQRNCNFSGTFGTVRRDRENKFHFESPYWNTSTTVYSAWYCLQLTPFMQISKSPTLPHCATRLKKFEDARVEKLLQSEKLHS